MYSQEKRHIMGNEGRYALITGSARGIGAAIAIEYAKEGLDFMSPSIRLAAPSGWLRPPSHASTDFGETPTHAANVFCDMLEFSRTWRISCGVKAGMSITSWEERRWITTLVGFPSAWLFSSLSEVIMSS